MKNLFYPIIISLMALVSSETVHSEINEYALFKQAIGILLSSDSTAEDFKKAYLILESFSESSPLFIPALTELQKIHFKNQNWDRFFGYSLFYRAKLLSKQYNLKKAFSSKLFALETLALARNCQWKQAEKVAQLGIELATSAGTNASTEIQQALFFIKPVELNTGVQPEAQAAEVKNSAFSLQSAWPIPPQTISKLKHPKSVRFEIVNRCKK